MKRWRFIGASHINFISEEQIDRFSRENGVDVICILPQKIDTSLDWLQIILNEKYAAFGYWVDEELYCQAGGENQKLKNGKGYELLIRLAQNERVGCIVDERVADGGVLTSDFYTDAYILSRYSQVLRETNYFEPFLEGCVQFASQSQDEGCMLYLQDMLSKNQRYWELYQATQPFLLLIAKTSCYNVVNDMAQNLAQGIHNCGKCVEVCNVAAMDSAQWDQFFGKRYQAVIGFQNKIFECFLENAGCYLTDLIHGPKIQMLFDHPFWFYKQLNCHGRDFFFATHDETYVKFIQTYAPDISGCFLIPFGGLIQNLHNPCREYDVLFMGTYWNYRDILSELRICKRNVKFMAVRYLRYLKKWVNEPAEKAFQQMLLDYDIKVGKEGFVRMMYEMGNVNRCIIYYYREKIIRTLLDAGISLHVFGQSWKSSPFLGSDKLVCHDEVLSEQSSHAFKKAKISLNILSWHKGGCNERIINYMLAGAAVVTDKSSYIQKHFTDGRELCCYDLRRLEELPALIKMLLERDGYRRQIADRGRKKAEREYSVAKQASRIIAITDQVNGGSK